MAKLLLSKCLSLVFLLLVSITGWSQQNFDVSFSTGVVKVPADALTTKNIKNVFTESKFGGKHYVMIQFNKVLSEAEKKSLTQQGIELVNYVPNYTYTAIVKGNFNQQQLQKNKVIKAVFTLEANVKAFPTVLSGDAPVHAIKVQGTVDITILTFEIIKRSDLQSAILPFAASIVEQTDVFKTYTLRVPKDKVREIVTLPFIEWAEYIDPPNIPENLLGRTLHRVSELQDGVRGLTGEGLNVGIFDEVAGSHIDFWPLSRKVNVDPNAAGSHGTHVSGTVAGGGNLDPNAKGMAPKAKIYSYYGFSGDVQARMAVEIPSKTLIASNHSYHDGLGVQCGVTGASAGYSLRARNTDLNLNNFVYHMHCHSSGNAQSSCANGWGTITGTGKAAKNNIVVGNITSAEVLSGSSSCGPVHDGRVKPEIVGMGTSVFSTYPNNTYGTISGTSMSTPGITGTVTLLAQRYKQLNGNSLPPSTLIKNTICNTAIDLGTVGPDYRFGYGRINALKAVKIVETNRYALDNVTTGQNKTITITVPANTSKLNVMLTWNDPAATALAANALVNNLDLTVINGATTSLPWILNPNIPANPATQAIDNISNIEQVTILNPAPGTYTLNVAGTAVVVGANQPYALTWDVESPAIEVIYPNGNEKFNPATTETITWDNSGVTGTQTIEYSLDGTTNWTTIATVAANVTRQTWSVPSAFTSTARIRVTSGSLSDVSNSGFNILNRVTGFSGNGTSCVAGNVNFSWTATPNANVYEIFYLNDVTGDYVSLANNITGTSFTATGLTPNTSMWFSIVAKNSAVNASSLRSNAINVTVSNGGGGMGNTGAIAGQNSICGAITGLTYSVPVVSGATSYTWTLPVGGTIVSGQGSTSIIVDYSAGAANGNVTVTASNGSCTSTPSTLPITIGSGNIAAPTSGGNQTQAVCPGGSVPSLTATASVPSGFNVKWYTTATGNTTTTNPILNSVGTVTYFAAAAQTNTTCEGISRTPVTLTINQVALATATAQSATTFCQGNNVTLTASAGTSYLWSNGATTQSISVTTSGNYSCTVTNLTCTNTTTPIAVTVNNKPIATATALTATTFCQPNSAQLSANTASAYLWSNGSTTKNISASSTGNYSVVITDANGCSSNPSNAISVVANPQPTVSLSAMPYTKLLPGLTTTLTATVSPTGTYTYEWRKDGNIVLNATTNSIPVTIDKMGAYTVKVTNSGGCNQTSSLLSIVDSPSVKLFITPNPNNGKFDVIFHSTSTTESYTVSIFDNKGSFVYRNAFAITSAYQRLTIDLRNKGKGLYLINLYNKAGNKIASGKVVTQ